MRKHRRGDPAGQVARPAGDGVRPPPGEDRGPGGHPPCGPGVAWRHSDAADRGPPGDEAGCTTRLEPRPCLAGQRFAWGQAGVAQGGAAAAGAWRRASTTTTATAARTRCWQKPSNVLVASYVLLPLQAKRSETEKIIKTEKKNKK